MMHPARAAAMGAPMPVGTPPQVGMVRSADEMMDGGADDIPPAKRQRVAKLPGGALYPEQDWINMHPVSRVYSYHTLDWCLPPPSPPRQHPISLRVQLPNEPSKPEWKFDGAVITIPELPLNLLVSTLRDRIIQHTGSTVGASKIRLSYGGKMLMNSQTIAVYNLEDEDLVVATVRDEKKKK